MTFHKIMTCSVNTTMDQSTMVNSLNILDKDMASSPNQMVRYTKDSTKLIKEMVRVSKSG